ncbi:hypothetical protein M422DRAFT_247568 [Sphaerobolus stellatus SS14]|nr:hypothetical protein M422DRAFT_247568 [Sphaerobolus stellatus SS14]
MAPFQSVRTTKYPRKVVMISVFLDAKYGYTTLDVPPRPLRKEMAAAEAVKNGTVKRNPLAGKMAQAPKPIVKNSRRDQHHRMDVRALPGGGEVTEKTFLKAACKTSQASLQRPELFWPTYLRNNPMGPFWLPHHRRDWRSATTRIIFINTPDDSITSHPRQCPLLS